MDNVAYRDELFIYLLIVVSFRYILFQCQFRNQRSTSSLMKSRTNNLELIMAIRRAEMEIVHRESLMYCSPTGENKSLNTRPIKMDLNLKSDTKVKRILKDTVLADQEAMVEIMGTQVVDPTGVELEAMVIRQEGQAEGLTSVMVNKTNIYKYSN